MDPAEASGAPKQTGPPWRPEERKLLGKFSDQILARRLGCSVKAVQAQRESLGIPAPSPE